MNQSHGEGMAERNIRKEIIKLLTGLMEPWVLYALVLFLRNGKHMPPIISTCYSEGLIPQYLL